ncbi:MAG TPA: hypothetical protein PKG95_11225 [Anaerolineaceae bacterium]|nr:hypothetical protein [Anaerolineaceae bacterium]
MTAVTRSPAQQALEHLIFALTLVLVFLMAARSPLESDLWWHLRAGEETLQTGRPMLTDTLSFTRSGEHWVNHSWLSEVILALLYRAGGALGLGALVALLAVISMALVYRQMEGPGFLRAFLIILASLVAALVWSPRPQMASLVGIAALGGILYLNKWRQQNRLWLLLPLFLLWSNLHGGYSIGFLVLAAALGGEVLNHLLGYTGPEVLSWRRIGILALWSAAAALVVLINPNLLDTWRIPFQTVGVQTLQQSISEWASPDFHDIAQQPFIWLLLATLAACGLSGRRLDGVDLLTVTGFAYLALVARRNFGPFALVATPVLSRHLWAALQSWPERVPVLQTGLDRLAARRAQAKPAPPALARVINLLIVALLTFVAFIKLYIVTQPTFYGAMVDSTSPTAAVAWLRENRPAGPMLSEYGWGGYLTWHLPEYPVFVDGRTDLFGDDVIGDWLTVVEARPGWPAVLERWGVRLILLEPGRPVLSDLEAAGWTRLYADDAAVLYGR